jgi:hypothetical protein
LLVIPQVLRIGPDGTCTFDTGFRDNKQTKTHFPELDDLMMCSWQLDALQARSVVPPESSNREAWSDATSTEHEKKQVRQTHHLCTIAQITRAAAHGNVLAREHTTQ